MRIGPALVVVLLAGATVAACELEAEGGRLIYSFDIKVAGKDGIDEVHVDARTGAIVSVGHESK